MSKAAAAGIALDEDDAKIAKGMLARGDRQSDIAAYFGVNGGRIAELATGGTFWWTQPAPAASLPPAGPYVVKDLLAAIESRRSSASGATLPQSIDRSSSSGASNQHERE